MDPLDRVTASTLDVLEALLGEPAPTWGLRLIAASGRRPGTVYPILERLERLGWVESGWEQDNGRPGPRRRLYVFTAEGEPAARQLVRERRRPAAATRPTEATA